MTSRDIYQQQAADAFAQHERLQGEQEAFIAACFEPTTPAPTPTETFLADLRSIHAVDPVKAVAVLTPQGERPLREDEAVERAFAKRAAADLAHDERTEGYARRPFRTNHHD